jgi:peptidoglycan/LPS O-acetylase OafA/YrhL
MESARIPGSRYYRPELDVVRFLAFLLVFLHHSLPQGDDARVLRLLGGSAQIFYDIVEACRPGLSLFFALSAFLIFELLFRERQATGTLSVKQFYVRRILRIWPLYYFALALGTVLLFLPGGEPTELAKMGWFAWFAAAWYISLHTQIHSPVNPLWSISVEEQFYLIAPWVIKYFRPRMIYGFCIILILASNSWLFHLSSLTTHKHLLWYDTFVQFQCFGAGILLALVLRGRLPKIPLWLRLLLLMGAFAVWFFAVYPLHSRYDGNLDPTPWLLISCYFLASLGSIMVLVAFLGIDPKFLPRWAIYLGRISYGLYVFHGFALYFTHVLPIGPLLLKTIPNFHVRAFVNATLTLGLPLALTFVMAVLSYRYLETPFLKMKKRHAAIESEPIIGDR